NSCVLISLYIMSDVEKIDSYVVFIKDGEILLIEEKRTILESYALIDVDVEQLILINKDTVLAKRSCGSYCRVLVSDKKKLPNNLNPKAISMEELSIFLMRSEKYMRGLLLTNYYLIYRSIYAYAILTILVSVMILYLGGSSVSSITALLIILLFW